MGDVVAAGALEQVVEPQPLHLVDAPGRDPLTADPVFIDFGLFQQQDRLAGLRHHLRQGRAADAAAHDDEVVSLHVRFPRRLTHAAMRTSRHGAVGSFKGVAG